MDSRGYHQQHIGHHYHPCSQTSSSETETMFDKLMQSSNGWSGSYFYHKMGDHSVKQEGVESDQQGAVQNGYGYGYGYDSHMSCQHQASRYPDLHFNGGNHLDGSFSMQNSLNVPENAGDSRENTGADVHESGILFQETCSQRRKDKNPSFADESWDMEENMFSVSNSKEIQIAELKHQSHGLCKQLSWPSSSTKMVSTEKLVQLQDAVKFKVRAKRGFATHPRSISERIRRTRISEKIKTLEGLFPEMDKRINTADKLELAVWYIKDLQKQIKMLTSARVKCKCSSEQKQD